MLNGWKNQHSQLSKHSHDLDLQCECGVFYSDCLWQLILPSHEQRILTAGSLPIHAWAANISHSCLYCTLYTPQINVPGGLYVDRYLNHVQSRKFGSGEKYWSRGPEFSGPKFRWHISTIGIIVTQLVIYMRHHSCSNTTSSCSTDDDRTPILHKTRTTSSPWTLLTSSLKLWVHLSSAAPSLQITRYTIRDSESVLDQCRWSVGAHQMDVGVMTSGTGGATESGSSITLHSLSSLWEASGRQPDGALWEVWPPLCGICMWQVWAIWGGWKLRQREGSTERSVVWCDIRVMHDPHASLSQTSSSASILA